MGKVQLLRMKLNSFSIFLLFLFMQKGLSQNMPIIKWIEDVYVSNSTNLDSIRKTIEKLPKQNISLQTFRNYTEPILEKDTSINTLIKTMYIFNALVKDQDSIYYKNLDYETRFFCDFLLKKSFVYISDAEFFLVRETYNTILNKLPQNFINKEMVIDKRKIEFYKKYMLKEPRLIGENTLRYFRYDSIYEYNDLILEYILKNPDSVVTNWKNNAMKEYLRDAMYTLAYFNDERIIPYIETIFKQLRITNNFLRDLLSPYGGNIGEKIQLSLWQVILKKQDILEKQKIEVFGGAGYVTYTPFNYLILQVARQSFQKFFPAEYEQLKSIKEERDKFIFVKNLVDKRLQELNNKK